MKVGDLVREITRMEREPDMGLVIEIDLNAVEEAAKYLVHFNDGEDCWMAKHHLEMISEARRHGEICPLGGDC